jgi:hypothetical protein
VLQHLYQIESRIVHVARDAHFDAIVVDALFDHFERFGAPVMIGGGVLAHTLLGVRKHHDDTGENSVCCCR